MFMISGVYREKDGQLQIPLAPYEGHRHIYITSRSNTTNVQMLCIIGTFDFLFVNVHLQITNDMLSNSCNINSLHRIHYEIQILIQ